MPKRCYAQERALTYLDSAMQAARRTGNLRLPTVFGLAAGARVSHVTMLRAVRHLVSRGMLLSRHGAGITVRPETQGRPVPVECPPSPPVVRLKWERIAILIEQDILSGVYRRGSVLPSVKELQERYGASGVTLRKALARLVREDRLTERCGKRTVPLFGARSRARNALLLVARGDASRVPRVVTPRTESNLRTLEHECAQRGIELHIATFDDADGRTYMPKGLPELFEGKSAVPLMGVLIWQAGIDRHDWGAVAAHFARLGKPMALLDETGEVAMRAPISSKAPVKLFNLGFDQEAGFAVGNYLLTLGHRSIAYVSPVHKTHWSCQRLAGLHAAFSSAGFPNAVQPFTTGQFSYPREFLDESTAVRLSIEQLLDTGRSAQTAATLRARTLQRLRQGLDPALESEAYREAVLPLAGRALLDGGITAWVAADDDTALPCLEFLRNSGKRVPQDISLVGFDDGFDGFAQGLTTYNFNAGAYIQAMLAHVICPDAKARRRGKMESLRIPGALVVRRSAGAATQPGDSGGGWSGKQPGEASPGPLVLR